MPIYKYIKHGKTCYYVKLTYHSKQYMKRGFRTKQEAKQYEFDFFKYDYGKFKNVYFKEVIDSYLKKYKLTNKLSTYDGTYRRIHYHIYDYFKCRIRDLTIKDFELFIDYKLKNSIKINYVNRLLSDLKLIAEHCEIYFGYRINDIYKLTKLKDHDTVKQDNEYLSLLDLEKLVNCIPEVDKVYKLMFIFDYFTGLRISELLGLKVSDFDFNKNCVYITHQNTYLSLEHKTIDSDVKTTNSNRVIYFNDFIKNSLLEHINKYKLRPSNYIFFTSDINKPIYTSSVRKKLKQYCIQANIREIKFHTFRKSFATNLIENNLNNNLVIKLLGHNSIQTTNKHYLSLTNKDKLEVVNLMDNLTVNFEKK